MRRMLTLTTVHFQARVDEDAQRRLAGRVREVGASWPGALSALKRLAHERSRKACAELFAEAVAWDAERWMAVGVGPESQGDAG